MRIVSRTTRSILEQKRENSMRKRQAAGTLEGTFPRVEQVRIQLHFLNTSGYAPAAQSHALYPSAQAYFEFACPHGDCDGSIDLNSIALTCLKSEGAQADGTISCPGSRTGTAAARSPCNLRVDYWIAAQYKAVARLTG